MKLRAFVLVSLLLGSLCLRAQGGREASDLELSVRATARLTSLQHLLAPDHRGMLPSEETVASVLEESTRVMLDDLIAQGKAPRTLASNLGDRYSRLKEDGFFRALAKRIVRFGHDFGGLTRDKGFGWAATYVASNVVGFFLGGAAILAKRPDIIIALNSAPWNSTAASIIHAPKWFVKWYLIENEIENLDHWRDYQSLQRDYRRHMLELFNPELHLPMLFQGDDRFWEGSIRGSLALRKRNRLYSKMKRRLRNQPGSHQELIGALDADETLTPLGRASLLWMHIFRESPELANSLAEDFALEPSAFRFEAYPAHKQQAVDEWLFANKSIKTADELLQAFDSAPQELTHAERADLWLNFVLPRALKESSMGLSYLEIRALVWESEKTMPRILGVTAVEQERSWKRLRESGFPKRLLAESRLKKVVDSCTD